MSILSENFSHPLNKCRSPLGFFFWFGPDIREFAILVHAQQTHKNFQHNLCVRLLHNYSAYAQCALKLLCICSASFEEISQRQQKYFENAEHAHKFFLSVTILRVS